MRDLGYREQQRRNDIAIRNGRWRRPVWIWRTWAIRAETPNYFAAVKDTWTMRRWWAK